MEKEDLTFDPTLRRERMLARIDELKRQNREDAAAIENDIKRLEELKVKRAEKVKKKWETGRKLVNKRNHTEEAPKPEELFGEAKEKVIRELNSLILGAIKNNLENGEAKGQLVFGKEILGRAAELGFTQEQLHNIAESIAKEHSVAFTKPTVTLDGKLVSPETIEEPVAEQTEAEPKKKVSPKQLLQMKVDGLVEKAGDKLAEVRASLEETFSQEGKIKTRAENLATSRQNTGVEKVPQTTEELQKELDAMIVKAHLFENADKDTILFQQNKDEHQLQIRSLNAEIAALAEKLGIPAIEFYAHDLIEKYEKDRTAVPTVEAPESEETTKEELQKKLDEIILSAHGLDSVKANSLLFAKNQADRGYAIGALNTEIEKLAEALGIPNIEEYVRLLLIKNNLDIPKEDLSYLPGNEPEQIEQPVDKMGQLKDLILQALQKENKKIEGNASIPDAYARGAAQFKNSQEAGLLDKKISSLGEELGLDWPKLQTLAEEIADANNLSYLHPDDMVMQSPEVKPITDAPDRDITDEYIDFENIPHDRSEEVNTNWQEIAENIHSHLSEQTKEYIRKERLAEGIASIQEEAEKDLAELEEKIIHALQLNETSQKKILFEQNRAARGETIGSINADIERLAEKLDIKNIDEFVKNIAHSIGIEIPEPVQEVVPTEKMIYDLRKKVLGNISKRIELGNELKKKKPNERAEVQKQIDELKESIEDDKGILDRYVATKERVETEERIEKRESRRISLTPKQKKLTGAALEEMQDLSTAMFENDFANAFGLTGIKRRATYAPEYKALSGKLALGIWPNINDPDLIPSAKEFFGKLKVMAEKYGTEPETGETLHDFITRLYALPATEEIVLRKYEKKAA